MYTYLGCYIDGPISSLSLQIISNAVEMTMEMCFGHCLSHGMTYGGVGTKIICGCGNAVTNLQDNDEACDNRCPGNDAQICGGLARTSVFEIRSKYLP